MLYAIALSRVNYLFLGLFVYPVKTKGSNAERELVVMFHGKEWSAIRVAGSGRMNFPSPDVLAGNGSRVLAIECKSTKHPHQYFEAEQIAQLLEFSEKFGAEPWLAVKFSTEWHFLGVDDLSKTKSGKFVANKNKIKSKSFEEI